MLQKKLSDKLSLGGEIFTQGRSATYLGPFTLVNIGTQYSLAKDLTLLTSLGHSILGQNVWMGYIGLGWG